MYRMKLCGLFVIIYIQVNILISLISSVYSRALGSHHRNAWRPGHKKHKNTSDSPWDPSLQKRDPFHLTINEYPDECCPSVTEIIQPLGGVSKTGKILELYRDQNSTQSFYQTSCEVGIKGKPCRYIENAVRHQSICVQQYTYTYALVREFNSVMPWRMDYIRVRGGCTCEIRIRSEYYHGKRKRIDDIL